ncbi:hypothetical protein BC751_1094 [Cecembia calidifontis]|jgi:hypothetical protein|uniref:Uncharacterized protein n=1 Tax=Cecembia calidifontis TaxID=1187080 RepID=A0A4Q7P7U6_9BACT|nr:hypothetical protein BC751_1094 [Cecembia calidifontis]
MKLTIFTSSWDVIGLSIQLINLTLLILIAYGIFKLWKKLVNSKKF